MSKTPYPRFQFWMRFFIGVAMLVATVWLGYLDRPASAFMTILAGGACVLFSNLTEFKRFSVGKKGLTAELSLVIDEANASIRQVRELATLMAKSSLMQSIVSISTGDFLLISQRLQQDLKVIQMLNELKVSKAQMADARKLWDGGVNVLFSKKLIELIGEEHQIRLDKEKHPEYLAKSLDYIFSRPLHLAREAISKTVDHANQETPNVTSWRKILSKVNGEIPHAKALLEAYENFRRTGELKDTELLN